METLEATNSKKEKSGKHKIAAWISCALWAISIALSFEIPPSSSFIWVPDTALLLGFFPLIWICPFSLIWIAFGGLTAFIGFFLLLLSNIPDASLPAQTIGIKKHLAEFHPCWSWMILGVLVTICGSIRLTINTVLILTKRYSNKPKSTE